MLRIKKGDTVIVIAGKNKGKKGKVIKVFPCDDKVLVEGINMVKKNMRPSQKSPQGGIISREMPLDVSNVLLFCGRCSRGASFRIKFLKDDSKIRVCLRCGEKI